VYFGAAKFWITYLPYEF